MRTKDPRFSVPFCIFNEPMPAKMFVCLVYLISVSSVDGMCKPGYEAMKRAMRDADGDKGSNATVRTCLMGLNKRGWIFSMKKTNGRMVIVLRVPYRFRKQKLPLTTISVVQ